MFYYMDVLRKILLETLFFSPPPANPVTKLKKKSFGHFFFFFKTNLLTHFALFLRGPEYRN